MAEVEHIQQWVRESGRIVGFTGAGISTESGIPDFRSPNGVWAKNRMIDFQEFLSSRAGRIEYWRQKCLAWPEMRKAQPNAGHQAFVDLANQGKLTAMITQNIDGLHHKSGLSPALILEIHGNTVDVICLSCDYRTHSDHACRLVAEGDPAPECPRCGGFLKPATISFGQSMPVDALTQAEASSRECDLFLAVGSSLQVQPAASLPLVAKHSGAKLVIVNRDPTPLDKLADAVVRGEIGQALPLLVEHGSSPLR